MSALPARVGDPLPPLRPGTISRERMIAVMRVMGDSNPIHVDEELARSLGFRGLVNQGPANLAYVANMLLGWTGPAGRIRSLSFRFLDNVVPGDELVATGEITRVSGDAVTCDFRLSSPGRTHLVGEAILEVTHG
jgi:acyl dehydratase